MFVFPPTVPRLDVVEAAGQAIPEGTNGAVVVTLPAGSPTNQTVRVKASGFTNDVQLTVAVTPTAGPSATFNSIIPISGTNSAIGTVNVVIPDGSYSRVTVWSR